MRRLAALLCAALLLAPAWLLGTESGLRLAAVIAGVATDGALSVGHAEGRLLGDVFLRDVAWREADVDVEIDRAEVNLRLTRLLIGRLQAERLEIGTLSVAVREETESPDDAPLTVAMPVRLAVEHGAVGALRLRLPGWTRDWVVSDVDFGARWRDRWIVVGTLRATTVEAGAVQARGRIAIVEDRLLLEEFEARRGEAVVTAAGALAIGGRSDSALDVNWQDLELPGDLAPGLFSPSGTSRLDGPWPDYRWRTTARVQWQGIPGDLAARGRGSLDALIVDQAELGALGGVVRGDGRLEWAPRFATRASLAWEGIDPARVWPEWRGRLNGAGALQARWRGDALQLDFDASLHASTLRGYPLELRAQGRTQGGRVVLRELTAQSGASLLAARGQLWPELGLSGEFHSTDLRSLWAGLAGRAELRMTAAGPYDSPRFTARGEAQDLVFRGVRVAQATLDAGLDLAGHSSGDLQLVDLDVGVPLQALRISGSGRRERHQLRVVLEGRESSARFGFEGAVRARRWRGRLVEATVHPARAETWRLEDPATLLLARGRFESEPACLAAGASRACAQLTLAAERQRIAFRLQAFDLKHLRAWLPAEWETSGEVSGSAALGLAGGELVELRADLDAAPGVVAAGGVRLEYGPGSLRVEPEGESLRAQLLLRPAGGEIDGDVRIAPGPVLLDRALRGTLRIALPDLAWLPVLTPEIASAQGALEANLGVSGTSRSPSLDGVFHLRDGRVQLTTPGIELTQLTASVERGRDAPLVLHARALSGDGPIRVDGELRTLQPKLTGELTIRGENVLGVNRPEVRAWLSPDLTLALDGLDARLTGELGVPRAEITPREFERSGVAPSPDQVIVETEGSGEGAGRGLRVTSEVRIVLGDAVRFDGLGLKTRFTGAITALDDPTRPTRGRGELRLDGGRYKAYGQDLQIETGRLIFSGGPVTDPAIDLSAVRKPREDVKVGLRVRGRLDAPEFSLFSEPAMSREEQLSWLVLGRSLSQTLDANQRAGGAGTAMSLGLSGGEYLAQQLAPKLGLDDVTLGTRPGDTTDLARLTIGKYLSPKLFVSYGYGLFQPGHFFRLQYDVTQRVKLVGESGVQQGGDLLYTIER